MSDAIHTDSDAMPDPRFGSPAKSAVQRESVANVQSAIATLDQLEQAYCSTYIPPTTTESPYPPPLVVDRITAASARAARLREIVSRLSKNRPGRRGLGDRPRVVEATARIEEAARNLDVDALHAGAFDSMDDAIGATARAIGAPRGKPISN